MRDVCAAPPAHSELRRSESAVPEHVLRMIAPLGESSTPPPPAAPPPAAADPQPAAAEENYNEWECAGCYYENAAELNTCMACGLNKDSSVPADEEVQLSGEEWECLNCFYMNPTTESVCKGCGTAAAIAPTTLTLDAKAPDESYSNYLERVMALDQQFFAPPKEVNPVEEAKKKRLEAMWEKARVEREANTAIAQAEAAEAEEQAKMVSTAQWCLLTV